MADSRLDIILAARDASAAAFAQVNNRLKELGGSVFSLKGALAGIGVGYGMTSFAKSIIDTASSFEQLELKLDTITKGKGKETLALIDAAVKDMPVDVAKATESWVMMGAMGLTPTVDKLRTLVDVSSVLGEETMPRVARALGQMASLGKVSAEELNQLSEVGINARKYLAEGFGMTVEELQKAQVPIQAVIDTIWRGLDADYAGGAKRAMTSWNGLMTQFRKTVQDLERQLAASGVFDALKQGLDYVNTSMAEWIKTNEAFIKQDLPKYVRELVDELKSFFEIARLPSVTNAFIEAQQYMDKGLIDRQKFWAAGFVERQRMLDQAKQLAATDINVSSRSGYKNAPGVSIPTGYRSGLAGPEESDMAAAARKKAEADAAKKELDEYMKSSSGLTSYGAWEDQQNQLEVLRQTLLKTRDAAAQFNMELYKKAAEDDVRRLEKEIPFLQKEGLDERINEVAKSVETGFDSMIELSARTAEAMQDNFSDFFFDAMTGELKSFEDYTTAVFRSIQRAFADMAGQMLTQKIFGTGSTGGTSGGGGWLSDIAGWIGGLFGSGTTAAAASGAVFAPAGMVRFAAGGVVNRPTVFPFANGVGLMGEAGPEAVMPLKRMPDGRLGVASSAPPAMNVTIHIAAPQGRVDRESLSQMQTALYSTLQRAGRRNA